MARLKNIHPGEILSEEFLLPLGISAYKLAKDMAIPQTRISEIIKGNRRITADTALRFSKSYHLSVTGFLTFGRLETPGEEHPRLCNYIVLPKLCA
jgi:addiction module HigA family antidote